MRTAQLPRSFYIPKGAIRCKDKQSDAEAWIYSTGRGRFGALTFFGKQQKPLEHSLYRSLSERESSIRKTFEGRRRSLKFKADMKAERKAKGRGLAVGDVLKSCWGYDQTNVDFYEVIALVGKTMVEIRKIGSTMTSSDGIDSGTVEPLPGEFYR